MLVFADFPLVFSFHRFVEGAVWLMLDERRPAAPPPPFARLLPLDGARDLRWRSSRTGVQAATVFSFVLAIGEPRSSEWNELQTQR
jgi:hypothetical protein